ncbi:MAG: hypothetical protein PVF49_03775 [Anaerolineales bacterium]|jgi:hypothetical protein
MAKKASAETREKMNEHIPSEAREHMKAAREAMRESVRVLFPPEFIEQRRAARREMLLAARSMIDRAIERIDDKA